METSELPGPLLRERKVEPGSVPNARCPGPGSRADKSKCNSIPSPSCMSPPAQWPAANDSSSPEECKPHSVLSSRVSATSLRVRTLGRGPKAIVEWWAPLALAALPAQRLSSLLMEGLPHDHGMRPLGLQTLPGPVTAGAQIRDGGCRRGARNWGRWVCVGSAVSAGVKGSLLWGCVLVMGAHSSVILFAGRWQRVFRWDSLLFSKAFWRIRYKRLKCTFTLSVFGIY